LKIEQKESLIHDRLVNLKELEKDSFEFEIENQLNRPLRG